MRGIVLAGGQGTRLGHLTRAVNKHLLPVYDKPLLHYPVAMLMLAGVRDIAIVTSPAHVDQIATTMGDGSEFGVAFEYVHQPRPSGIADGLSACRDFVKGERVALVLGDNVFFGPGLGRSLADLPDDDCAHIFAHTVSDPRPYATVVLDDANLPVAIEEKPVQPRSNLVVPGLYWLPADAISLASQLLPGPRGEMEITDLNRLYMERNRLRVHRLPRGSFWIDAGTPDSLFVAANFVRTVQQRQGLSVASLVEIAVTQGWT